MRLAMRLRTSPAGLTVERHAARRPQSWQPEKRKIGGSIPPRPVGRVTRAVVRIYPGVRE
jgi:hypothetical protein